ncbi:hypothetical protein [Cognatilysobacter bugurensis]|uniref:Secreted protein n=1 Tax=Cognatilysobacter bugurensis TaxID=543356 RepID=A0A918SVV7_9GAMM|nr:hypothetical protein [Lysobacter bugurensis]GHA71628.1 hypothetical protein GCM10007067_05020 [Lysobacter bugurensis]
MNRKLHNTASALMVPGTLLLLALAAQASTGDVQRAGSAFHSNATTVGATATAATALPARPFGGRTGRVRHSVALPFFSFAPRG